ncbi:MAG: histidine phosphatase family protein [Verrucomicrobiota bacterium]
MKQLLLARHAKSSWDFPGIDDHQRDLNDRGVRDAPRMGAALSQRGIRPDLIKSSSATRARKTAAIIAPALDVSPGQIEIDDSLYLASPSSLLLSIQQLDEAIATAIFFGHNPGMHGAADQLARDEEIHSFPTLAVARLEFDCEFWGQVEWGTGFLVELLTPKTLVDS